MASTSFVKISGKGWVLLTTLILVSLVFMYYFLVHVKNKEKEIINNNLRVLSQVNKNIDFLRTNYKKRVEVEAMQIQCDSIDTGSTNPFHKMDLDNWDIIETNKTNGTTGYKIDTTLFEDNNFVIRGEKCTYLLGRKVPNSAFFNNELINRKDVFDFIVVSKIEPNSKNTSYVTKTLYTNNISGHIQLPEDSTARNFMTKDVFDIDFGFSKYLAFNIPVDDQQNVYLTGFVSRDRFNAMKREVSFYIITLASILTVLILLALPIIKLRIMSNVERLYISDVFLSGGSMLIGSSVLIILSIFLIGNAVYVPHRQREDLERLCNKVEKNFKKELKLAITQLNHIRKETSGSDTSRAYTFWKNSIEDTILYKAQFYGLAKNMWDNKLLDSSFRYFNSIFWTDSVGKVEITFSSVEDPSKASYLSHRLYVSDIINGKGLKYGKNTIAIQSIRSVNDGSYEIGIGITSGIDEWPVLAISFSMASVMEPVMGKGYGFCIYNNEGQTYFHSDIERNLNENFIEESGMNLKPFIKSGKAYNGIIDYHSKEYFLFTRKMKNLDGYNIAVFVDKNLKQAGNTIAINTALVLLIGYWIVLFLFYLLIYYSTKKRSKLKQKVFLFNWLRPYFKYDKEYVPLNYSKQFIANLVVILYMLIVWAIWYSNPDILIYMLFLSGLFVIYYQFFMGSARMPYQKKVYSLFHTKLYKGFKLIGLFVLGLLFLIRLDILVFESSLNIIPDLVFIILIFIILFGLDNDEFKIIDENKVRTKRYVRFNDWIKNIPGVKNIIASRLYKLIRNKWESYVYGEKKIFKDEKNSYLAYLLSFIILLAILPTLILYQITYTKERSAFFKQNLHYLVDEVNAWESTKSRQFYRLDDRKGSTILKGRMASINSFMYEMEKDSLNFLAYKSDTKPFDLDRSLMFDSLYNKLRVIYGPYGEESGGFVSSSGKQDKLELAPFVVSYNIWSNYGNVIVLIIILIVILFINYNLVKDSIFRIFGIDFKNYYDKLVPKLKLESVGDELMKIYEKTDSPNGSNSNSFNNTFIIGVNASHVFKIRDMFKSAYNDSFVNLDFLSLQTVSTGQDAIKNEQKNSNQLAEVLIYFSPNLDPEKIGLINSTVKNSGTNRQTIHVFIEHFEFAYNDIYLNRLKLRLLQYLVDNPAIRIVISSEINPNKIYTFYQDLIRSMEADAAKAKMDELLEINKRIQELKVDYKKWLHLLGGFYRFTVPLETCPNPKASDIANGTVAKKELVHGTYLSKVDFKLGKNLKEKDDDEDMILYIQEVSHSYYFAIWNSLSKEERYIVYDIAKDKFVNTNNVDGIMELMHKGILVYDHSLRLMNESFTNFILSKVNSDEALARELEQRKKGRWNIASSVLLILVVSLIIFISFGKISLLNEINALIGSLAAVFALLLRVGGIFKFGSSPSK